MRTENITVPSAVTRVNHVTVFGQTLELESGGTEELWMLGCVSISDRHEHTTEVTLEMFHTIFLPNLS